MTIHKIISGGQTGVDRAALDVAIKLGIFHGGWCPKGRLAELGAVIPVEYLLLETESSEFSERTKLNIRDSDGTLVLVLTAPTEVSDGTVLTIEEAKANNKPCLIIDLSKPILSDTIAQWVGENGIEILNVAGPRESQSPGIYCLSYELLERAFVAMMTIANSSRSFCAGKRPN